jgi:predicted transcriptional regulator
MQLIQKQPQMGETFEDLIVTAFEEDKDERGLCLRGRVTPQMTNHMGTISSGVMTTILTNAGERALGCHKKGDLVTENVTLYFLKPVQIENELTVYPNVLELSRKFGQVDIEAFHEGQIVAKALLSAQLIDRS